MGNRRGRRSQSLGASIVIKKWLNIKPRVHEFSEDDEETESEDDGIETKVCLSKHNRRKSETLRVQYISTKDVRVTIGTWNVAGKSPYSDLEIDEWLRTKEPADMYIIGFQEVVPLSAGNVLGVADDGPIPKWEAIIRRTLNRRMQPKEKYRSYSAPPSPDLITSPPDDALPDEINIGGLDTGSNHPSMQDLSELINTRKKPFPLKRIYSINAEGSLDWPEYSLDRPPQTASSDKRLRRVLSSSGRIGSDHMEKTSFFTPQDFPCQGGLKRTYCSMGNLQLLLTEHHEESEDLDPLLEVTNKLLDEESDSPLEMSKESDEDRGDKEQADSHARYVRIVSKQMVGIHVSVWVCRRLRRHVNNLKVSPVGVGVMGWLGNKGSVSISMSLFQTWLCFVCSHLASGQKEGDHQKRNLNVQDIIQRTHFPSAMGTDHQQAILSHDRIFWFGDLNYRLNMPDAEIREFVSRKQWAELIDKDQLREELQGGHVFNGWKEGLINFPPTYKYEKNSDRYFGEQPREGEKKRSPAWCDRILWSGKGINQLSYWRSEVTLSDHRPVSAIFSVEVEVFNHHKLQKA
ncbi:Type I inositol 1,4,5-trisphosphate 5-phosphatase 2 [Acorus calamus]|uniref:Type I inositol 1,4,5-trisphosphate 5-phosphatase 2 n=1 Tax=Acorus calamus TaxID=4465 RepID=A0AAV9E0C4_ACOCL|nr:Type I inositol 1,4,5-trisphosphate 5-phosphatase 2 [Acorus calamus]